MLDAGDIFLYGWITGTLGTIAIYEWGGLLLDLCKLRKKFQGQAETDRKE